MQQRSCENYSNGLRGLGGKHGDEKNIKKDKVECSKEYLGRYRLFTDVAKIRFLTHHPDRTFMPFFILRSVYVGSSNRNIIHYSECGTHAIHPKSMWIIAGWAAGKRCITGCSFLHLNPLCYTLQDMCPRTPLTPLPPLKVTLIDWTATGWKGY